MPRVALSEPWCRVRAQGSVAVLALRAESAKAHGIQHTRANQDLPQHLSSGLPRAARFLTNTARAK